MTNAVYQATIEELEALLSPRVVSRSLQEGLRLIGKSPLEVNYGDIEKILKAHVYRQLQVTMPVTEAKLKINDILGRLKGLDGGRGASRGLERQGQAIAALRESLKPYNLYFEWPEVQKLRAQLQLLEREHAAGSEADKLVADARAQLGLIQRKLEDQLVQQAKALSELEEDLEAVKALGGPRVRRLEGLLGQIGEAQLARQLAPAEIERALKLATELRKLLESSVVQGGAAGAPATTQGAASDPDEHAPDLSEKLRRLDLESERRDLERLRADHALLLAYAPELNERLSALEARLAADASVGSDLGELRNELSARESAERRALEGELRRLAEELASWPESVDTAELGYLVQLNRSVLDTTLPPQRDISQLRSLAQLARAQAEEALRRQEADRAAQSAKQAQQRQALERLEEALERHRGTSALGAEVEALASLLGRLRAAQDEARYDAEALAAARQAEHRLEAAAASYAELESERQRARLHGLLSDLHNLPLGEAEAAPLAELLQNGLTRLDAGPLPQRDLEGLEEALNARKAELRGAYQAAIAAFRERARALDAKPILVRLAADEALLERDLYPDLQGVERALFGAAEARRAEQLHDLHRLENEVGSHQGKGRPEASALQARIDEARARLEAGEHLPSLEPLWLELAALQDDLARRSADFLPRLDAALERLEGVAMLNSEEVAAARRTLRHLASQREAFGRVSAGMRSELEASLREAEGLLARLEEQFEATRSVAGQLFGSDVLEGLFGSFGEPAPSPSPFQAETPTKPHGAAIERWLESFSGEAGVAGAILLSDAGEALAGRLDGEPPELAPLLRGSSRDLERLGSELHLGGPRYTVLETARHSLVLAVPASGYRLLLHLSEAAEQPRVLEKLERDLGDLRDLLAPP